MHRTFARPISILGTTVAVLCLCIIQHWTVPTAQAEDKGTKSSDAFAKDMDAYLSNEKNVEKIGEAMRVYFTKKQQEAAKAAAETEEKRVEQQFENPVKVDIAGSPVKGKSDARITIVEFSDFQCPFCTRGMKTMEDVLKAYPNDVRLVFKNLPLEFHPNAKPAAVAALAAGEQGKFWEMHDILFANQKELSEENFIKWAGQISLDVEKFKNDLKNPALMAKVEQDAQLGESLGVNGTPGFFVNGVQLSGAQPLPEFQKIIDRWLKKLNEKKT